jgi:hypothetical protein
MRYMVRTRRRLKSSPTRDVTPAASRALEAAKPEPSDRLEIEYVGRGEIVEYVGPIT